MSYLMLYDPKYCCMSILENLLLKSPKVNDKIVIL